jgi:hypothetical protein
MDARQIETAADPAALAARLPATPPAGWQRTDNPGGIVEYRLPDDEGLCAAGKVTVRPDVLGDAAVRVDLAKGCQSAGTTYYDTVEAAAEGVAETLETAPVDA